MGARGSMPAGLVANTLHEPNGELVDDQANEGRGEQPSRKRTRRHRTDEKGRSRNLVIPDSLYDTLCLYARRTKVKVREERRVNGIIVQKALVRSMTVSEAACKALASYLPKLSIVEVERTSASEE
jgi:hypothetical protein